jgi:hypothetical protein
MFDSESQSVDRGNGSPLVFIESVIEVNVVRIERQTKQ